MQRVPLALLATAVLIADLGVVSLRRDAGPTTSRPEVVAPPASSAEDLDDQIARVTATVEGLRALEFPMPPTVTHLSLDELRDDVMGQVDEGYPEEVARLDEALLVGLGHLPPGADLRDLLRSALGDQVAGFYDPTTGELVVGSRAEGERASRFDELTLAHELAHALVDATVGLPDLEALSTTDADAAVAAQALVEGDATALMNRYATDAFSALDQLLLAQEALALADTLAAFQDLPPVLRGSLQFPYVEGLAFVEHLLDQGGWSAVDAAYAGPPRTTLEIMDPRLYGRIEPVDPAPFGELGPQWTVERPSTFGAYDLLQLLEAPGGLTSQGEGRARLAAIGWRGGRVSQWSSDDQVALAVHLTVRDVPDFCDSLERWYRLAFPDDLVAEVPDGASIAFEGVRQDMVLFCGDEDFRFGIAPDLATASAAVGL